MTKRQINRQTNRQTINRRKRGFIGMVTLPTTRILLLTIVRIESQKAMIKAKENIPCPMESIHTNYFC